MQPITERSLEQSWQQHWQSGVQEELFITITGEGLKYGTVILAKRGSDGALMLKGREQRIRALLAVVNDNLPDNLMHKIACAEAALHSDGAAMMHMHFALAGFHKLEWMWQLKHLFFADTLLKNGWGINDMLKCFGISKFNPHHDERGRFATAENAVLPGLKEVPEPASPKFGDMEYAGAPGASAARLLIQGAKLIPLLVGAGAVVQGAKDNLKPIPLNMEGEDESAASESKEKKKPEEEEKQKEESETQSQSTDDVLVPDGKPIGESGNWSGVRTLPQGYKGKTGENGAEELFNDLTKGKGGKDVTPDDYPGTMVELPNGDRIGIRRESKSGPATIDVNTGKAKKYKFP